jgi:hypothetical protein
MENLDKDKENTAPETQNPAAPQDSEALKAANSKKMEEKRAENEKKTVPMTD